jgi:glycosyltransferase involved in cell wall biosynthesis
MLDFMLVIPFYNNVPGLRQSVASVVYDPLRYGLLIVDDGSSQRLELHDISDVIPDAVEVHIIRLAQNGGITKALNAGLEWLRERGHCRYVARLDCGDLCSTDRFTHQVQFMNGHADVDLVGSWVIFKNFTTNSGFIYQTPVTHERIVRGMHFRNLFIHPAIMWRMSVMDKVAGYRTEFPHAEDYGFCYEIVKNGRVAVLPEPLVICAIDPAGLSLKNRRQQLRSRINVVRTFSSDSLLRFLGIVKCRILLNMPYRWIYVLKTCLYRVR